MDRCRQPRIRSPFRVDASTSGRAHSAAGREPALRALGTFRSTAGAGANLGHPGRRRARVHRWLKPPVRARPRRDRGAAGHSHGGRARSGRSRHRPAPCRLSAGGHRGPRVRRTGAGRDHRPPCDRPSGLLLGPQNRRQPHRRGCRGSARRGRSGSDVGHPRRDGRPGPARPRPGKGRASGGDGLARRPDRACRRRSTGTARLPCSTPGRWTSDTRCTTPEGRHDDRPPASAPHGRRTGPRSALTARISR